MRKFNLGGWLRIGIVLSVIWIVIGGSFGWNHAYDGGVSAAVVAFGPLLVAWLALYGLVLLVRWIRRGFQASRSAQPPA